ncbi:hypothetical protein HY477_01145 [Candidatus Uhrbacteria bacterium]|nr:hypothetical protein [Candidatus Uhrbacteria bacterium]
MIFQPRKMIFPVILIIILVIFGTIFMLQRQDNLSDLEKTLVVPPPLVDPSNEMEVIDSDNDKIPDMEEIRRGTDPNNPDTDGDGLTDWEEVAHYRTDPLKPDTDGDGYSDGQEVQAGYDPNSKEPLELH